MMPLRRSLLLALGVAAISVVVAEAMALEAKGKAPAANSAADVPKAAAEPAPVIESKPKSLKVASWGGAYAEAQGLALFGPYSTESGLPVDVIEHKSARGIDGQAIDWDVADLPAHVVDEACAAGLLEPIDANGLPKGADGSDPSADFFPGGLSRCGVASVAWSTVIVANPASFLEQPPATLADFFDIVRFPGERALPRSPKYVLELALLADGVAPADVYKVLGAPGGLERAAARLKTISQDIYWWNTPGESLEIVKSRKAAMSLTFSGRAFMDLAAADVAGEAKPLITIWEGQIYDVDMWAIAKSSKAKSAALDFVRLASRPDRLAEIARWLPYGPMRRSALPLVGRHASLGTVMAPMLPTSPENSASSLKIDRGWWDKNEQEMVVRFEELLATGFAAIPDLVPQQPSADAAIVTDSEG